MTEVPEDRLREMERGEEAMEADLDKLGDHLETAQARADEHRQRIEPESKSFEQAGTSPGGDMGGEAEGAQQGDDAEDAEGRAGEGGGATVHEAEQVEPSGSKQDDEGAGGDASSGGGSVRMDDVPVHEAEQVDPKGDSG